MNVASWVLFYLELEILKTLPVPWLIRWLEVAGRVLYHLRPFKRRLVRRQVQAILPNASSERLTRELFVQDSLCTRLSFLLMPLPESTLRPYITVEGWERLEKALQHGRGAVLLASHVGIPRLLRWYLRTTPYQVLPIFPIHLPRGPKGAVLWWLRVRMRVRFGLGDDKPIRPEEFSASYLKKARDHLLRNGLVDITGDGRYGDRIQPVSICSREILFRLGGIALGLTSGAPILPYFTAIEPGPRFRIEIQEPLAPLPGLPLSTQLPSLAAAYAARLEAHILSHPSNAWFFFLRGRFQHEERFAAMPYSSADHTITSARQRSV